MDYTLIDKYTNEVLNGSTDLPEFNQPEHAGVCSAGPLLIGALTVCNLARESLITSSDAAGSQTPPANWQIDETQERYVQQWAEAKGFYDNGDGNGVNYLSPRLHLEDMHPANVFIEQSADVPVCIDCIVKFRRNI